MRHPVGIHVVEHPPSDGRDDRGPVVVLVHGSLDRAASFARTVRRLPEWTVVTYDRRGYGGSRPGTAADGLDGHVGDLLDVAAAASAGGRPVVAVGHSVGGDVVVGAALADPARFAAVGAYEPPMPWLGFRRTPRARPVVGDPDDEVEQFFRRMAGDTAWERLPEPLRAARRAEAPALAADLRSLRGPAPFDATRLAVPAVFARGGARSRPHHREVVGWLAGHVPGAALVEVAGAGHGAHLTHPDAFAGLVRTVAGRAPAPTVAGPAGAAAVGTGPQAGEAAR